MFNSCPRHNLSFRNSCPDCDEEKFAARCEECGGLMRLVCNSSMSSHPWVCDSCDAAKEKEVQMKTDEEQVKLLEEKVRALNVEIARLSNDLVEKDVSLAASAQAYANTISRVVALEKEKAEYMTEHFWQEKEKLIADLQAQVVQLQNPILEATISGFRNENGRLNSDLVELNVRYKMALRSINSINKGRFSDDDIMHALHAHEKCERLSAVVDEALCDEFFDRDAFVAALETVGVEYVERRPLADRYRGLVRAMQAIADTPMDEGYTCIVKADTALDAFGDSR